MLNKQKKNVILIPLKKHMRDTARKEIYKSLIPTADLNLPAELGGHARASNVYMLTTRGS